MAYHSPTSYNTFTPVRSSRREASCLVTSHSRGAGPPNTRPCSARPPSAKPLCSFSERPVSKRCTNRTSRPISFNISPPLNVHNTRYAAPLSKAPFRYRKKSRVPSPSRDETTPENLSTTSLAQEQSIEHFSERKAKYYNRQPVSSKDMSEEIQHLKVSLTSKLFNI